MKVAVGYHQQQLGLVDSVTHRDCEYRNHSGEVESWVPELDNRNRSTIVPPVGPSVEDVTYC